MPGHHPEMFLGGGGALGGGKCEERGREGRVFSFNRQKSCASVRAFI